MKQKIKIIVLFIFVCGSAFVFTRGGQMQTNQTPKAQTKTAAEVYKNIQVLKDTPAEQLMPMMDIMSSSLGVKCAFCHVPDQWEKDGKEEKKTAREMITMTLALNKQNFNGRLEVSCMTCHNGRPHPASPVTLGENLFQRPSPPQQSKEPMPTVDQILDKYTLGLGGKDALAKVKTRTIKASRTDNAGQPVAEEIYAKSPNKMLVVTNFPQVVVNTGYSGTDGWVMIGGKNETAASKDELEQFTRDAQFSFEPLKLKEIYKEMTIAGTDKINDKEVYLVRATTQAGKRERLFFDKQTGLLARRYAAAPTSIGVYAFQIDYDDYRAVEGVKIPYLIKWSVPGRSWTRKIIEVKQNAPIDDAKFNVSVK